MAEPNVSLVSEPSTEHDNIEVKEDYTDLPTAWYIPGIHGPDHETRLSDDVTELIRKYRHLHGKDFFDHVAELESDMLKQLDESGKTPDPPETMSP